MLGFRRFIIFTRAAPTNAIKSCNLVARQLNIRLRTKTGHENCEQNYPVIASNSVSTYVLNLFLFVESISFNFRGIFEFNIYSPI